jgi:rhodanese-related sulfurtransferase
MRQIEVESLHAWIQDPARLPPVVLDVREAWEVATCRIEPSVHIPMAAIPDRFSSLSREHDTVVVCHHGGRSLQVALFLEKQGYTKVHNLAGGVHAWAERVDRSMPVY